MASINNNHNSSKLMEDIPSQSDWTSEKLRQEGDKKMYLKVRMTIDNGNEIELSNARLENGSTLLISASELGLIDTVRLLLSIPNVDLQAKNKDGKTALDVADDEDIKKMLINAGKGIFSTILRGGRQR